MSIKQFHPIRAADATASTLQQEIATHGYVLVRGWLPQADLDPLFADITGILSSAGWLLPGHDPIERIADPAAACGDGDQSYRNINKQIFSLESLHAFVHRSTLRELMHRLVGPQLLIHPKPFARIIFPNLARMTTPVHQDNVPICGDPETFTAWMPLHDCPAELGPLQVLAGSHRFGSQSPASGPLRADAVQGDSWVSGTIRAGDVLLFHSCTVHAASPNTSTRLRISVDCRFQDAARPIDPAALVFGGGSADRRTWQTTYANWRSDELKFYWHSLPLELRPSRAHLAKLAATAEPLGMRERYARILAQIDEQHLT